ncbi:S49 family peptidase [Nitzschia inconspicua]|uniref:S49 family peptidase n=1 Tax=Nitzschia inconspicua TaxID=303405 RepID=A0A9K3L2D2_9STRA|nr:S49 family peptidase [Nitzschia inconspicua]
MPISRKTALSALPSALDSSLHLAASTLESVFSSDLFQYFMQKLIDVSLPTAFSLLVIFFLFGQIRSSRKDAEKEDEEAETTNAIAELYNDLYGTTQNGGIMKSRRVGPFGGGGFQDNPPLPKNLGLPKKEYIRITNLNEKFDAYDFSMIKSTQSKAKAAAQFRAKSFERALGVALNAESPDDGTPLTSNIRAKLLQAEKKFLKEGKTLLMELQAVETKLAQVTIDQGLQKIFKEEQEQMDQDENVVDAEVVDKQVDTANTTASSSAISFLGGSKKDDAASSKRSMELTKKAIELQSKLKMLELNFLQDVIVAIGTKRAVGLRNAVLGDIEVRGAGGLLMQLQERPLSTMLKSDGRSNGEERTTPKALYVMNFPGDVQASQLNDLREEVTAVVRNAQPGDEALVVLQSGGGTVTGYGLAAGQLVRLKEKGLKLTIAVEQVAASGGYMMSCVADKIVASPFAVLGSIGVISEIPNVYERLKEEGIEFQTVTAGKFKRTLTPTKKVTKEDKKKSEEDIEQIFNLFKGWVGQNRPQLNIEEVATGETWFGPDALEKGLCDEIKTVDDVLLDYVNSGFNVFEVKYDPPPEVPNSLSFLFASDNVTPRTGGQQNDSLGRKAIRWLVRSFADEVQSVVSDSRSLSVEKRYMAKDDTADRVKAFDEFL